MKICLISIFVLVVNGFDFQHVTEIEDISDHGQFHSVRDLILHVSSKTHHEKEHANFYQDPFEPTANFPCRLVNVVSEEVPRSVHKLRPGDIDVIAAIGDSLTVGFGATASNFMELSNENPGLAFSIGGQWDWRNATTLPNILKVFNPNLVGFSTSDFIHQYDFNVAQISAMSSDLRKMAEILIKRMKADPRVDFQNHWKMITIAIGGNDICSAMCMIERPEEFPEIFKHRLMKTLNLIKSRVPRCFVNIVPFPSLEELARVEGRPQRCNFFYMGYCSCWDGHLFNQSDEKRELFHQIQKAVWQVEKDIAQLYRNDDSFTVVYQPVTERLRILHDGVNDFSLTSFDCFHPSQKGHAWAGITLWNNVMEPSGNKSKTWHDPRKKFLCPSEKFPYLHTYDNDHFHALNWLIEEPEVTLSIHFYFIYTVKILLKFSVALLMRKILY